ncbi:hypothetical protein [Actinophytocola gossypii]|uniref:Cellulase n=1 Tax=Actinophytocola gossypii TaxID=2812003 RepID=A0ABT2JCX1_9PSEU|nr:hypothetical protein [Actinophytocola gossypii]MCT2585719.1 hypothetical protein [Actinophytocola gossypii]
MHDEHVRTLFHRIGDGPPLGIDPRDVISRGRRLRARRRRLAVVASTAAIAGVTMLVGVVAGGEGQRPTPENLVPAGPTTTTSVPATPAEPSSEPPPSVVNPDGHPPPVAT